SPATAPDTLDPAPSRRITRAHRGRSMTQGYGPEHGQQGQWGQGGQAPQAPQWGQASPAAPSQPQWGQASPAAPYATGPGSSPAAPAAPAGLVRWLFLGAIAVVVVRGLYLLSNIIVSAFIVGIVQSAVSGDDAMASAGIGVLLLLLGLVVVDIVSVALLVLAIGVVVKSSGRTRTGAIVVGAAVLASFLVYLATRFLFFMLQNGAGYDVAALVTISTVEYGLMGVHWRGFSAVVIVGARLRLRRTPGPGRAVARRRHAPSRRVCPPTVTRALHPPTACTAPTSPAMRASRRTSPLLASMIRSRRVLRGASGRSRSTSSSTTAVPASRVPRTCASGEESGSVHVLAPSASS